MVTDKMNIIAHPSKTNGGSPQLPLGEWAGITPGQEEKVHRPKDRESRRNQGTF